MIMTRQLHHRRQRRRQPPPPPSYLHLLHLQMLYRNNGIESFPMRSHEKRRLPCAVQTDTTGRCSHFAKIKAEYFENPKAVQSNLDQLRKHCKFCVHKPKKTSISKFDEQAFSGFVNIWTLEQDKRKLVKLAQNFLEEYRKQFPNSE